MLRPDDSVEAQRKLIVDGLMAITDKKKWDQMGRTVGESYIPSKRNLSMKMAIAWATAFQALPFSVKLKDISDKEFELADSVYGALSTGRLANIARSHAIIVVSNNEDPFVINEDIANLLIQDADRLDLTIIRTYRSSRPLRESLLKISLQRVLAESFSKLLALKVTDKDVLRMIPDEIMSMTGREIIQSAKLMDQLSGGTRTSTPAIVDGISNIVMGYLNQSAVLDHQLQECLFSASE